MPGQERIRSFDVAVVGAGFAGMYMLHKIRPLGLSVRVFEVADDVGGTWYWNRYPGARCDVESLEYSYSFDPELQQEWQWSERYSAQPEILAYAGHVADRFDLRSDIEFETRVKAATWDGESNQWSVVVSGPGGPSTCRTRFLIMATGCLSSPNRPNLPGLDQFEGRLFHTGEWPHKSVDFTDRRVAMIGTGSSAIQATPIIAEQCRSLVVFQRTANYSVPAHNGSLDRTYESKVKAAYEEFRALNRVQPAAFGAWSQANERSFEEFTDRERQTLLEEGWALGGFRFIRSFGDVLVNESANEHVRRFVSDKIRAVVDDPAKAELLVPDQIIGCKRLCLDNGYFQTFNAANVSLIDIRANPITSVGPDGLRLENGERLVFDDVVLATGFDAMTGTIVKMDIRGVDGVELRERWTAGPRTYLGLMVPEFPNLFLITGPGSPSVLTNMLMAIEHHVEWIARCLAAMVADDLHFMEPTADASDQWVDHVNSVADRTLMTGCNSWYLGANVEGKARVFMPLIGFPPYVEICDAVAADGYRGFTRR